MPTNGGGFTGISLAGTWECGACGATGDGWYEEDEGLVLHDENEQPFNAADHVCGNACPAPAHAEAEGAQR